MVELTEIMQQKGYLKFTELLNRIRTADINDEDIDTLNSRVITEMDDNYPTDALHIWAENKPVNEHNEEKLASLRTPLVTLTAHDQYPEKATLEDIKRAFDQNENRGLDYQVKVKIGASVMLTVNSDVDNRLILSMAKSYQWEEF